MSQILNRIIEVDPNNSEAVKESVGVFFQNLLKHVDQDSNRWLRALEDVINRFPKYCINHRTTFETFLINFIDSHNNNNVIAAAKCVHLLQQIKTTNPKSGWRRHMTLLCYSANKLMGKLYAITTSTLKDDIMSDIQANISPLVEILLNVTNVPQKNTERTKVLNNRLKNVFICIQAMLVEVYPTAKPIQPQMILDLIVQILSIACVTRDTTEDLVAMKIQALRTLDALIACLGPNLIPYSPLVFRLVMQTLRWSSDNPNDHTKNVRRHAYTTLRQWLTVLHVSKISESRSSLEDELTTHIINDITPPKKVVELTMGPQPTRNMSKKAQRKMKARQINESSLASHMPGKNKTSKSEVMNNEVAMAALDCAETLFIVGGIFLKPITHKIFQERIIRECFNIQAYSEAHSVALLRALEAVRKCSPHSVPPPTQYCLQLYATLVNSEQHEIAAFCSRALLDIRLHLHCSPPSLNFALTVAPEKANKKKRVSEKNLAVLESLLGKDKIPPNGLEEIITIADEPVSKKSRLEDDAEKISLSSDNMSSVEISDDSGTEDVQEINQNEERSASGDVSINEIENESQSTQNDIETLSNQEGDYSKAVSEMIVTCQDDEQTLCFEDIPNKNIDITEGGNINETNVVKENSDTSIHNAPTQVPLNDSVETLDGDDRPHSLEVTYDYPNTGSEKVAVLDKIDDANLPSTNETDDIQITCGQVIRNSQDIDGERKSGEMEIDKSPKLNGIEDPKDETKDINVEMTVTECESSCVATQKNILSVEDMMADFVDEVNDDA
ncbi:proline-, glutamic acid- and leucine-rich protein 1-like [Zerene cesonia]|uniref:proline-, glutamic acid- and leucine-rich protein 1-like n=1 Tax=Zerene cesonia TaxID=33412 RepID=UPI0018E4FCDC|nr:proline-, glutamic acid- and leucine-rich protein 1-like [Zerene cesonia]